MKVSQIDVLVFYLDCLPSLLTSNVSSNWKLSLTNVIVTELLIITEYWLVTESFFTVLYGGQEPLTLMQMSLFSRARNLAKCRLIFEIVSLY